jgi:hypothetical protein
MRPARTIATCPRQEHDRRYVQKKECEALWEANESVDHPGVFLPNSWHLNRARVPVSSPPDAGP